MSVTVTESADSVQSSRESALITQKKGIRLVGEDRDRLASQVTDEYQDGKSIRDIAAATGRSYGFVHRVLVESGIAMRSRGGATRRRTETSGAASR